MPSLNDNITTAWKNDLDFLRIVCDLSGLAAALWRPGTSATAEPAKLAKLAESTEPAKLDKPTEPAEPAKPAQSAEPSFRWTSTPSGEHPCLCDAVLRTALEEYCRAERPGVFFESNDIFCSIMKIGPFFLVLGPAAQSTVSEEFLHKYAAGHGMKAPVSIPKSGLVALMRYTELLYCHFSGSAISRDQIYVQDSVGERWSSAGALEEYQLAQSENDRSHRSGIDFEKELLQAVKNGDIDEMKALMGGVTPDFGDIGEVAQERNKEYEYMVVAIIALMTRAAIEGGVRPEIAHEVGDVHLKKLAQAVAGEASFLTLGYNAMMEFVGLVRRVREEKRSLSYVEACKDYIEENLRKELAVGDIAPAIGVSRTYLSNLFRQAEGITIQQYIQREKCRHAARMLQYSDYSVAQIAQYFGFSSQSYFGTCFRTWYGVTPHVYRRENTENIIHV